MSKIVNITQKYLEECRIDFEKALRNAKLANGKIAFAKTFNTEKKENATVLFTSEAWTKMVILLQEFSKEVAWHGVTRRLECEGANKYIIDDILVYPQEVTGATVEMDTAKYATWLQENDEDERFYNIHMQGHSHVNMAPNPSGVDLNHQEEILEQLGDDDFYIFMIYNKSFKRNIKIYDLRKNILFEDADIDVKIFGSSVGFDEFLADAKNVVMDKAYNHQPASTTYYNHNKPYNPIPTTPITYTNGGKPAMAAPVTSKLGEEKPKSRIDNGWVGNFTEEMGHDVYGVYDDHNDPYSAFGYRGN